MQQSDNGTKSTRPNLLSGSEVPASDNGSILNTLDSTKKAAPKNSSKKDSHLLRNSVLVLALIACGLGVYLFAGSTDSTANKQVASVAPSPIAKPDGEKVTTHDTTAEQAVSQSAIIETEASDSSDPAEAKKDPKTKLTDSLEAGLPVSGNSLKTALESPKKTNEKPVKSVNAERVPEKKKAAAATNKSGDEKATDRDVNILTALVGDEKSSASSKNGTSAKSKPAAKQNTKQTKTSKHEEDGPDIVERKPGDSTTGLLLRCKKLGFVEGELCRWRICSGRWDTDAACKPPAAASQ